MRSHFFRRPPLSIAIQAHGLVAAQPQSRSSFTGRGGLVWRGSARPTPLSEEYRIQIRYRVTDWPETKVLSPALQQRGGELIPHMYRQEALCLFNPGKGEWDGHMKLASTILPWCCLWLYFYEVWFVTGQWHGGGDHPDEHTMAACGAVRGGRHRPLL